MTVAFSDAIDDWDEKVRHAQAEWNKRTQASSPLAAHEEFVKYLRRSIPYYQGNSTEELPIVDRDIYQRSPELFRPVGARPREYTLMSSGTTGRPIEVTLDAATWYAVNHYFFEQIRAIADLPRRVFCRGEPAVVFVSTKPGRPSFVRPLPSLDDGLYIRLQLTGDPAGAASLFNKVQAPILYGKPTYLLTLRSMLATGGALAAPWSPRLLLVSGERLHEDDRQRLRTFFGAPVVDALASTEGGLIAATAPDEKTYRVLGENAVLEVLRDGGDTRQSGYGELILTNIVNHATAIARYRTGDFGELQTGSNGTQKLLRLDGREPRNIRLGNFVVATELLSNVLGSIPGVEDFRIDSRRDGTAAVFRWVPSNPASDLELTEEAIRSEWVSIVPGWPLRFERCRNLTAPGGKKRRFT